ncbi:MAG TPA: phage portal protein [Chthoniobacterales bacterium]
MTSLRTKTKTVSPTGRVTKRPKPASFMEVFEAAKWGGFNGVFLLPGFGQDTASTMPQLTRQVIAQKAVLGYNNIPELRAVIDGLAIDEVDTALWPKARTSSRAFNREATNRFHEENKDARSFDLRQVDNIYSAQFLVRRTVRLLGDLFGQLARPTPDFLGRPTPSLSFLPGYQCTSDGAQETAQSTLRDGIRFDAQTRAPVKYRFELPLGAPNTNFLVGRNNKRYAELDAADVLHFHDPFLSDQIRGISTLAPFANQMFSVKDIDDAETTGQIIRSGVAFALETVGDDIGTIPKLPGVVDTEVIENKDGTKTIVQKIRLKGRDGTREVQVYTPPAGMKLKTVESNRGGALEYRNHLIRGLPHCTLYPPEWILFITGLAQGTVFRGVQNRVQKIANFFRANGGLEDLVSRYYVFWLWMRIKAGVFDQVGVPDDWFLHKIIYPANMSVDLGREGRLYAELVASGKMSWADYHALFGRDDEDVDEEIVDKAIQRRIMLREKVDEAHKTHPWLTLTYNEVWPPAAGTAQARLDEPLNPAAAPTTAPNNAPATSNGQHARI